MKVRELIEALKLMPPDLDAEMWDSDEDDYVPVVSVLYEEGAPYVFLLPVEIDFADEPKDNVVQFPSHLVGHFPCEGCKVCRPVDPRDQKN